MYYDTNEHLIVNRSCDEKITHTVIILKKTSYVSKYNNNMVSLQSKL